MIYLTKRKQEYFHSLEAQLAAESATNPIFRIEMSVIPSMNDYISLSRHFGAMEGFKKRWLKIGFESAIRSARRSGFEVQEWTEFDVSKTGQSIQHLRQKIKTPIVGRAKLILRIWRPTFATYDVFNPYTKSIVDGFVQAGVMIDDDCFCIESFEQKFMGVDESLKPTAEMKQARRIKKLDKPNRRLPVTARYYFDFIQT